jgi:5-methylcytosine-specific restriction endonuclease McrA
MYSPEARARRLEANRLHHKNWREREENRVRLKEYRAGWYAENREDQIQKVAQYREANFDKNREWQRTYKERNREEIRSRNSEYRKANRDKDRHRAARRRFRKAEATVGLVTQRDLDRLLSAPCMACGATEGQTIEHMIPLARGGSHSIGNLATLCLSCNTSKSDLTWVEWKYSGRPRAAEVFGPRPACG